MRLNMRMFLGSAVFAGALLFAPFSGAQQKQPPITQANITYDLSREVTLLGTVVSYTAESNVPPLGAHVMIQTSSGPVDVHLGSSQLIQHRHLTLNAGDSVRIIGESVPYAGGTVFAARIIQKGLQAIAVRSTRGFLIDPIPVRIAGGAR